MFTREQLRRAHEIRMIAHWGNNWRQYDRWPQSEEDWRRTPHGAPWDTNVHMAEFHLKLATQLKEEEVI